MEKNEKVKKLTIFLIFLLLINMRSVQASSIFHNSLLEIKTSYSNLLIQSIYMISIICLIIGVLFLLLSIRKNKPISKKEVTDLEISKIDPNLTSVEIKNIAFSLYKKSETAKTKFKYNELKELLSEDLYQKYEVELKELKKCHQKLVITGITLQDIKILSIQKKEHIEIKIYLYVNQYDYMIDKDKKIIRGTDESKYEVEYKITLEKKNNEPLKIKEQECIGKWIKN